MALKKVSDVAKNAGISIEETVKVLQASGVQVSNGNDTVKDEDVTAAGLDKRGQLDRRQEMLQKALERHKKGVKIKEVVVSNKNTGGSQQDGPNIKLSKEELKKRKKLMEQHIKKVDEDRIQYNKEKAAQQYNPQSVKKTTVKQETKEMQTVSTDVKTTAVNQNNNTANQNNTIASNNNEASKNSHKQSYNKIFKIKTKTVQKSKKRTTVKINHLIKINQVIKIKVFLKIEMRKLIDNLIKIEIKVISVFKTEIKTAQVIDFAIIKAEKISRLAVSREWVMIMYL